MRIGTYRLIDLIGSGGMGEVWSAEDIRLGRKVAIKRLHTGAISDDQRRRFLREARTLAAIDSPYVVHLYDLIEGDDQLLIVMELLRGKPLDELIDSGIELDRSMAIFRDLVKAMTTAHEAGIVHRDLKPRNIIVTEDGRAVLLDLGLALELDAKDTRLTHAPRVGEGFVGAQQ